MSIIEFLTSGRTGGKGSFETEKVPLCNIDNTRNT